MAAISPAATPKPTVMLDLWLADPWPPINHGRLLERLSKPDRQESAARASSEALEALLRFDDQFGIDARGGPERVVGSDGKRCGVDGTDVGTSGGLSLHLK